MRYDNWRPPSLSELIPYQISLGLTHLGSEASNYSVLLIENSDVDRLTEACNCTSFRPKIKYCTHS